jgi:hypothetical protein
LDEGIVFVVNIGSSLVDEDKFTTLEEGAADAQQLLFACRETSIVNQSIQAVLFHHCIIQVAFLKHMVQLLVSIDSSKVQVLSEGGVDKHWLLVDDSDGAAKLLQRKPEVILPV